ncbi:MAG: mechanosensitive ion channel [Cyanobacteria bacterium M_surface_10_m2_119]|nr:mechanosensitive ion channel [Cyanobacteria bacterium M_surface_10_m2_119]
MDQLLHEIFGWLGYLQRGAVVAQLLLVALPVTAAVVLGRNRRTPLALRRWLRPAAVAVIALVSGLLAGSGHPWRFSLTLGMLYLGWQGLNLLHLVLRPLVRGELLHLLESRLLRPGFLVLAALGVIRQLDSVQDLAIIPVGQWFGIPLDLGKLARSVLIIYLVAVGSAVPAQGLAWFLQRALALSDGSRRALGLMLRYLTVAIGLLWVANHLGFNATAIVAIAGGLSVGLGFGIKEVFSNFISGLWLLLEGSVRPGEVLFVDGDPCEVRSLGLRAAVLWRDRDNAELVIPNQTFFTTTTTTYTGSDRLRRSQVLVGAAYRHDPAEVVALLGHTAREVEGVLASPPPRGLVLSYGDSSIQYALRFWIANPMDNVSICSAVNTAVWQAFRQQGIEIPFPQRVQYSISGPPDELGQAELGDAGPG